MKALALVLVSSTGCLVVARTTTTTTKVGIEKGEAVPAKLDHLALAASATDRTLTVHAVASGTCSREIKNVFEVRESKHLAMGGADDPRAKVLGLFVAPVTLPVSGLVSSLSLLGGDTVTRVIKPDHQELAACTRPADHLPLAIELASGEKELTHSNDHGDLVYSIPLWEPYEGTITVRSGEVSREVAYHQSKPAYVAARAALQTCGAGAATLALQVNDHGGVQLAWVGNDTDGTRGECVRAQLANVAFPVRDETIELPFGLEHVVDTARRITPVCARVAGGERQQKTLARVLEEEDLLVTDDTCEETYTGWVERTGTAFTVHVRNAAGARHTLVPNVSDIPAAYHQLVQLLVAKETDSHSEARAQPAADAEPAGLAAVAEHDDAPMAPEGSWARHRLFYGRFGIGSLTSLGAGYRVLWGPIGYDISVSFGASSDMTAAALKNEFIYAPSPWYLGVGASAGTMQSSGGVMVTHDGGYALELTAGHNFSLSTVRSFLQADVTVPTYHAPATLVVSLGIGGS